MVVQQEDIRAIAAGLNVDLDSLDLDSIRLPAGEDFGILSDDEYLQTEEVDFKKCFDNIIVVDNLPLVAEDKYEKLLGIVRKIYSQIGDIKEDWMPLDHGTQKTLGYCFIEYNTTQEAELAKEKTHKYKLDRSHILSVNMLDDIELSSKIPAVWVPPEFIPYIPMENLQKWVMDEKARDQFVIRAGSDTEVFWNDARQSNPEPVVSKSNWTESFVQWSPLGTYLATLHRQGVAVWGGASTFNQLRRYEHSQVEQIDFSPGERFLVTYSSQEPRNPLDTHRSEITFFDVKTRRRMITSRGRTDEIAVGRTGGDSSVSWPIFRWGGGREDKYFAKIGKNAVSVYETETFSLIGKKSIPVENIVDFSWSPTDSILALFVPELDGGNQPGKVSLVQIPSKEELRQKIFYSVSNCKMYWQNNGDYLAVQLDHCTKTRKSTHTGFVLFRIKERGIPVEDLELENKSDKIIAFAWEQKGHRFAILHGDNPRTDVSFYSIGNDRVSKLTTLKGKQANALYWSPTGRFIVLAGLKSLNGQLEFYDVDELETMAQTEHFMATNVEWDPTGRYVTTTVTSEHETENGFNVWSFSGKLIYRILKDNFFQFSWRPRPPCVLTAEKEEEIAKNLKKYCKKYEAEDQDVSLLLSKQDRERRKMLKEDWQGWVREWKQLHEEEKLERQRLRDGEVSDNDEEHEYESKQVEVEEFLDVLLQII